VSKELGCAIEGKELEKFEEEPENAANDGNNIKV
jgi:hypothetical protein